MSNRTRVRRNAQPIQRKCIMALRDQRLLRPDGKVVSLILVLCCSWVVSRPFGSCPVRGSSVVPLAISCWWLLSIVRDFFMHMLLYTLIMWFHNFLGRISYLCGWWLAHIIPVLECSVLSLFRTSQRLHVALVTQSFTAAMINITFHLALTAALHSVKCSSSKGVQLTAFAAALTVITIKMPFDILLLKIATLGRNKLA